MAVPLRAVANNHRREALRLNQRLTNHQLAEILRDGAVDAEKLIKEINNLPPGVGAATRRAQLRVAAEGAQNISQEVWRATDAAIRTGIFRVTDLAVNQAMDIDWLTGMPLGSVLGYSEAFAASAGHTAQALIARSEHGFTLSERVFRNIDLSTGRIHRVIDSGLVRNLSAKELSREVRGLIDPRTPGGITYAANRLARTEISNSYHWAYNEHLDSRPWVYGVEWQLSGSHPKPDECDVLAEEIYPTDEVPDKPHPQCLCYTIPILPDEDEFLDSLLAGEYDDFLADMELDPVRIFDQSKLPVSPELEKLVKDLRAQGVSWKNIAEEAKAKGLIATPNPNRMKRIFESSSVPKGPATIARPVTRATVPRSPSEILGSRTIRGQFDPSDASTYALSSEDQARKMRNLFGGLNNRRNMASQWGALGEEVHAGIKGAQVGFVPGARFKNIHGGSGFSAETRRQLEEVHRYLAARYPTMADRVVWAPAKGRPFHDTWFAQADRHLNLIEINDIYGNNLVLWNTQRQQTFITGWHSSEGARGTMIHEFGHQLHNALPKEFEDELRRRLVMEFGDIGTGLPSMNLVERELSQYATTNFGELLAEGFAEYHVSPKPRKMAMIIGQTIDKWIGGV